MTWHNTSHYIASNDVTITWPDPATDIKTSKHFTSKHKTSPPWNGRRRVHSKEMIWASRWSVALRTFYRQILSVLYSSFPFGNFRPRLVRALLVNICINIWYIVWFMMPQYCSITFFMNKGCIITLCCAFSKSRVWMSLDARCQHYRQHWRKLKIASWKDQRSTRQRWGYPCRLDRSKNVTFLPQDIHILIDAFHIKTGGWCWASCCSGKAKRTLADEQSKMQARSAVEKAGMRQKTTSY